jgi:hypothetical protein
VEARLILAASFRPSMDKAKSAGFCLPATDSQGEYVSLNFKDSTHTLLEPSAVTVSDEPEFRATLGTQELVTLRTGQREDHCGSIRRFLSEFTFRFQRPG